MKEYTASKGRGRPTVDAHEAYSLLAEKMDMLRAILHGFNYSGFLSGGHKTLAGAANHLLGIKDGKKRLPPDLEAAAVELVPKQAEALGKSWA
jgi:type I restriction enzyme R subunit